MSDDDHQWYGDEVQHGNFTHPTYTCQVCGTEHIRRRDHKTCCDYDDTIFA